MSTPTKSKDTTVPVGSMVRVIDSGKSYTTYTTYLDMARFMGLLSWSGQAKKLPEEGKVYRVVAKAIHVDEYYGEILGLEDSDGNQVMIGIGGVAVEARSPSLASQVADLESRLDTVTRERDALTQKLATVREALV